VLLTLLLTLLTLQTPSPWGLLWVAVPAAAGVTLLMAWRFGLWSLLVPALLLAGAVVISPPEMSWAWWIPAASLTGAWMGLREEGGPASGERAWMLMPLLVLSAALPWMPRYPQTVARLEKELAASDRQLVDLGRELGYQGERLATLQRTLDENASLRRRALPNVLPTLLFAWMALLVVSGRSLSSRAASSLKWPALTRGRLREWRLPDGAIWIFLAGLGLLVADWPAWAPTAWTLLLNAGLGFCVQGIAVVESLLLARGVPPSIIILSMLFVFTVAMPVFMLTTAALGLSDVWLDFRRLEPAADESHE
jgi:hypothetical protein